MTTDLFSELLEHNTSLSHISISQFEIQEPAPSYHWRTSMFPEFRKRGNGPPLSVFAGYYRRHLHKAG